MGLGKAPGRLFFDILMGSAVAKAMAGQGRLRQATARQEGPVAETGGWPIVR
jgi:hypothetical protein